MGLFSSDSDMSPNPEIRQVEKIVAKESKADQQSIDHAVKDLAKTEKAASKAVKVRLLLLELCELLVIHN